MFTNTTDELIEDIRSTVSETEISDELWNELWDELIRKIEIKDFYILQQTTTIVATSSILAYLLYRKRINKLFKTLSKKILKK